MIAGWAEFAGILQVIECKVCIAHGQGGMPKDLLQGQNAPAIHDEMADEYVSQYVRGLWPAGMDLGLLRFRSVNKCRKRGAG